MLYDEWIRTRRAAAVDGHTLSVHTDGGGPHVTLLHGFPTSSYDFTRLWPSLTSEYTAMAVDHLGFGQSDKPAIRYSFGDHADRLLSLWNQYQVHETVVVAHGYSVSVAQELLARHARGDLPVHLSAVVFLNGTLDGTLHPLTAVEKMWRRPIVGDLMSRFVDRHRFEASLKPHFSVPATQHDLDHFWAEVNAHDGLRIRRRLLHYLDERIAHRNRWLGALQTDVPLHFVWGADDPNLRPEAVELARSRGTLDLLPRVGHYPHWEAPSRVLQALEQTAELAIA